MQAGFAQRCVNPPLGMAMEGLGQVGGIESIHDDLFVRALYLTHDGEELLILGCDLLFFERYDIDRFKGALSRRLELPASRILLNCSHTHAGPMLTNWSYRDHADPVYLAEIETGFVEAACEAKARQQAVTMEAGMTATTVPVSRRKPDADGQAQWAPYFDGITCTALPFVLFKDAAGQVVSLLFSVSCHPSMIYTLDVSADYPGAATRRLNAHVQTEGCLFLQGAGGDTKPRPVAFGEEYWKHGTWEEMEAAGQEVSDAIIAQAKAGLTPVAPELRAAYFTTQWPFQPLPPRAYYETVRDNAEERADRREWAKDMLFRLDRYGCLPESIEVSIHAVQLGAGVRLIGLDGELVGELGNLILGVYDQGVTFPMGYTDGCDIYLASSRMPPEHGYEVDSYWEYHWPAPLAPVTDDVLRTALTELRDSGRIPNIPLPAAAK